MNRTGATQSRRTRLQRVGRLAALLVALAGLFVMHGMADHGTAGHGAMPGMGSDSSAMVAPSHAVPHEPPHAAKPAATQTERLSPLDSDGHDQMGLLGLCLAVLVALFASLASRLRALARTALAALLPAGRHAAAWWVRARDPAPPNLSQLSIQRC